MVSLMSRDKNVKCPVNIFIRARVCVTCYRISFKFNFVTISCNGKFFVSDLIVYTRRYFFKKRTKLKTTSHYSYCYC